MLFNVDIISGNVSLFLPFESYSLFSVEHQKTSNILKCFSHKKSIVASEELEYSARVFWAAFIAIFVLFFGLMATEHYAKHLF